MNISRFNNSNYVKSTTAAQQSPQIDTKPRSSKTQNVQKPDAISSATKTKGGDHYFEAKA
jgi:hypothetical protein